MAGSRRMLRAARLAGPLGAAALLVGLSACGGSPAPTGPPITSIAGLSPRQPSGGQPMRVLASTSIVADVARNVARDLAEVEFLLGPGSDPHGLALAPGDLQALQVADVVFLSGLGLEDELLAGLSPIDLPAPVVSVSEGIQPMRLPGQGDDSAGADPHVWLDPTNVMAWVENITTALSSVDPPNADQYERNAEFYLGELEELDHAIANVVSEIRPERRILVTDHAALQYFARRYGFAVLGSVLQTGSTQAEPSPRQLAELQSLIQDRQVPAIFVSADAPRALIDQLAADLRIEIHTLYLGSLSPPGGPAATYLELMMFNALTIQSGLSSDE